MKKEMLKKGIEELTTRLFELARHRAISHPFTVAELREKHSLALQLYAEEAGIKMSALRINRFTGNIYSGAKERNVTEKMLEGYESRVPLYSSELLWDEFPVKRKSPYAQQVQVG